MVARYVADQAWRFVVRSGDDQFAPAEDAAAPDSLEAGVAALREDLRAIADELERLSASNRRQAETMARKVEVVQELHEDNQRLRRGELEEAQMPLVRHLIELLDQIGRARSSLGDEGGRELGHVETGLVEGLRRSGIERVVPTAGERFDPDRHHAIGRRDVVEAPLHETVAEVRNALFVRGNGRVVRAAHVYVNVLSSAPDDAPPPAHPEESSE